MVFLRDGPKKILGRAASLEGGVVERGADDEAHGVHGGGVEGARGHPRVARRAQGARVGAERVGARAAFERFERVTAD